MPAALTFLPWVRQGAASAITTVDSLSANQSGVASVAAALRLNNVPVPAVSVQLRGPADVVGIDANQVVRTDPRPATKDFEPNYFPLIEFDRADFPWLFTPARATARGQLRPWVCLVLVRKQPGVTLANSPDTPLTRLQIRAPADPARELPDLQDAWAWAHAQVAADDNTQAQVARALNGGPELSLSRLVCPRILSPQTDYVACVVPTFELGRKAGLGTPIQAADLTAADALAPAWTLGTQAPTGVELPVYYHWEFTTGESGDFESILRNLRPDVPQGLGTRPIDVSRPGFAVSGISSVDVEGALLPIRPANGGVPPSFSVPPSFQQALANIVNEPDRAQAGHPAADPLLAPPIYGRWHAGRTSVSPNATTWLDQLNLDPRWRVAAAFGTRVVQEHQEALMASAWEQAGELSSVNQRKRQFQLSMVVGESLHQRNLARFDEDTMLRVAAPAFGRLSQAPGRSLLAAQAASVLPLAANRSAMRRIGRQRGPLTRRMAARGIARSSTATWVGQLNAPPAPPTSIGAPGGSSLSIIPDLPAQDVHAGSSLRRDSWFGAFFVAPERAPVVAPGAPVLVQNVTEVPGFFRAAAIEHLQRFIAATTPPLLPQPAPFPEVRDLVVQQTRPRAALPPLIKAVISTGERVLTASAPGVTPLGVEQVMAAPLFPQPMYEGLRDLSQQVFLPGLDTVKPETVLGLRTNRPFVEAYLVGLNHEMGRELLWRGYPTDQRGTYFNHFWGLGVPNGAPADISDLNTWDTRALGDPTGVAGAEQFVMLVRTSLLRRYPNAIIYLTPALLAATASNPTGVAPDQNPAHEQPPIFSGGMPPDVSFFGFAVTPQAATGGDGSRGHYVVIQEHPTEPRFGLDAGISLGTASHLAIGDQPPAGVALKGRIWGKNSAEMAAITRQLPVRLAIHASRLIASG